MERGCAGVNADCMTGTTIVSKLRLELSYLRTQNVVAALQYAGRRGVNVWLETLVLGLQIQQRNARHSSSPSSVRQAVRDRPKTVSLPPGCAPHGGPRDRP